MLFLFIFFLGIAFSELSFRSDLAFDKLLGKILVVLSGPFCCAVIPLDLTLVEGVLERGNNRLCSAPVILADIRVEGICGYLCF